MLLHSASTLAASNEWIGWDWASLKHLFWFDTVTGLTYGSIYALIALGYTLVYGVLRLINFAHSEVFITGAFAAYFTLKGTGFTPGITPTVGTGQIVQLNAI